MEKCTTYIKEALGGNLFDYQTKYTLTEVTEIFGNALKKALGNKAKVLIILKKIIVKGDDLNAEIYFDNTESSTYSLIRIKVIHTKSQVTSNFMTIHMDDKKYGSRSDIKGGYFWVYDSKWYAYVPDFNKIIKDIKDYLEFVEVI